MLDITAWRTSCIQSTLRAEIGEFNMESKIIYLDSAATTPMNEEVLNAMIPFMTTQYGNPNSIHTLGVEARKAIDKAREQVACAIGANPENIVFTSGGSEANNIVLKSVNRDVTFMFDNEHTSSINAADDYYKRYDGSICKLSGKTFIDALSAGETKKHINDFEYKCLAWYMYVNNETGKKNNVHKIGKLCAEYESTLFGTDCVQALGFEKINVNDIHCDFLTISSHKIHGPKGVGALYVRDKNTITPLISGGVNQEFGLRGGTENVAGIVGFGKACELALQNLDENRARILYLRNMFLENIDGINYRLNCQDESKILSIRFPGIDAQTLVIALASVGIAASAGSACRNKETTVNKALTTMGLTEEQARNTIRFSFMESLSENDVNVAANKCKQILSMLTQ